MNKFGYKYIPERNTLSKHVERSKHLFRAYNGWAVNEEVLKEYPNATIEIIDKETGFTYRMPSKKLMCGHDVDFGHGKQKVLDTKYWEVTRSKQEAMI